MKIVVLDGYTENPGDLSWEALEKYGETIVYDYTPTDQTDLIVQRIGDAEVVYTNKTPLRREVFEACPSIRLVCVLATGYDVVDVAYARDRGIPVCNVPAYGSDAVSQFAIALLLEICHHIGHHSQTVREGKWQNGRDWCYWDYPLIELAGKTMGIIGFGRIGRRTGTIAGALGMKVLAFDRHPCDEGRTIAEYTDLETVLSQSDVICLHCPLLPSTREIINKESIARMKTGVIIINNARGPLVNEQDLAEALNSGKVAAAGLDVVSVEPIHSDNPLLTAKNCFITPHISWAPREARQRIMDTSVENLACFIAGNPQNVVNP